MYRILYNKTTGYIANCKLMTEGQLALYLKSNPQNDYLDGSIATRDVKDFWVDPQTKMIGPKPKKAINIADYIRTKRVAALAETDWTQLPDSPLSQEMREAYAAYRQAWRDLPEQHSTINNIADIQWPIKP
jgi:hypothetical protein